VRWLRNIAVALGNAAAQADTAGKKTIAAALESRLTHADATVREHVQWALERCTQALKTAS
jgi:epoxyqueuosine reductase